MEFTEIQGFSRNSKIIKTTDQHQYRRNAGGNSPHLRCYFGVITVSILKSNPAAQKCRATAIMKENVVDIKMPHNHDPDTKMANTLNCRNIVRQAAQNLNQPLRNTYDTAMRQQEGAELVGWGSMYRTLQRDRREKLPPPPKDTTAAHEYLTSDLFKECYFAMFYQGMVTGDHEHEKALVFAHQENIAKLSIDTKSCYGDATFKTTPSFAHGHAYQLLIIQFDYRGHVFPFFKVVMTAKSRCLYDMVYQKIIEILPVTVNPSFVMSDYEVALQKGLGEIFPDATVLGKH